jgi:Flp pilus assembly pilin Flp
MLQIARAIWTNESGQGLPEYALLVAAVVVMVVVAATVFTDDIQNLFNDISDYMTTNSGV